MAYLRWRQMTGAELPGGLAVKNGKEVHLSGDAYDGDLPHYFYMHRRFGVLLRRFREERGLPITTPAAQPIEVTPRGESEVQTEQGWVAGVPGLRIRRRLFFEDGMGNASEELLASRLGKFHGLGISTPPAGVDLKGEFTAAIDPHLKLSVLTPWGAGAADLRPFLHELAAEARGEDESFAETVAALEEYLGEYLPAEPPPGWRFEADQTEFDLDAGETASFAIRIETPTAGAAAFSIQMAAEIEGELAMVALDPMVVRLPDDGSQQAELFGGDDLDGGGAERDEPVAAENLAREAARAY